MLGAAVTRLALALAPALVPALAPVAVAERDAVFWPCPCSPRHLGCSLTPLCHLRVQSPRRRAR